LLTVGDHTTLRSGYDFLRLVESRLRLMTNRTLDEYPEAQEEQENLARRLGLPGAVEFRSALQVHVRSVRALFETIMRRQVAPDSPGL
jgi:glutamate-ammonia-ligase adenylyltransferase